MNFRIVALAVAASFTTMPALAAETVKIGFVTTLTTPAGVIGRALMTNPKLLILDEATEGLAILAIDKNVNDLKRIADKHFIIEKGRLMWTGTTPELAADPSILDRYMGVSGGSV